MTDPSEDRFREFVRSMFGSEEAPAEEDAADPTAGNVVPREGNNPVAGVDLNDPREFARALFERAQGE